MSDDGGALRPSDGGALRPSRAACCRPARAAPGQRRAASGLLALGLGVAALVPKCPMCLAAYLSLLGLHGGLAAAAHPYARPAAFALAALALAALLLGNGRAIVSSVSSMVRLGRGRLTRQRARRVGAP